MEKVEGDPRSKRGSIDTSEDEYVYYECLNAVASVFVFLRLLKANGYGSSDERGTSEDPRRGKERSGNDVSAEVGEKARESRRLDRFSKGGNNSGERAKLDRVWMLAR